MTREDRPPASRRLHRDPAALEVLRRIALHRETATLLELRARQAVTAEYAQILLHRAVRRRELAADLQEQLVRSGSVRRHPSGRR